MRLGKLLKSSFRLTGLFGVGAVTVLAALGARRNTLQNAAAGVALPPPSSRPTDSAHRPSLWGIDTAGVVYRFEGKTTAVVFLGTECPISRKSIATLNALAAELAGEQVQLLGVLSEAGVTRTRAAGWAGEYGAKFPILFDGSGELAGALSPKRVPEAFVLDRLGEVKYRGRIDDAYVALGKPRAQITSHDLHDAMIAVAKGETVKAAETEPVGCVFEQRRAAASADVTYHRDVAPILAANCVACHKAGQVAPFTLTSYDDAAKRAGMLAEVTASRYMPPWRAAPQAHAFSDERRLSDREIATIKAWAAAGAPEGDTSDSLPMTASSESKWQLGEPDLIVEMPTAFEIPASGRDIYRAFPIKVDVPESKYISAAEFQPGAPSVVHHALLYLDNTGTARQKESDAADGKPGYVSFGGPGFVPSAGLGGWAPGSMPSFLPDGVGRPLAKGSDLVMQIHYHPDGKARTDKSRIGLYFAKKPVDRIAISIPLANRQIDIPPGDADYTRAMSLTLPRDAEVIGVTPHMHLVGKSMKATATLPSGETVQLIDVPSWDFRWQDQYRYAEPLKLPAGTKIDALATYDNSENNAANPSSPPKRVTRGEQTTDEMCMMFFTVVVDEKTYEQRKAALGAAGRGQLIRRLMNR